MQGELLESIDALIERKTDVYLQQWTQFNVYNDSMILSDVVDEIVSLFATGCRLQS